MDNIIYGVDLNSKYSAKDVRNAIIKCFKLAHDDILELTFNTTDASIEEIERFKDMDTETLVRKFFERSGGYYDDPTRESLIRVIDDLKQFALHFRVEEIAKKNYDQIMLLINNLK